MGDGTVFVGRRRERALLGRALDDARTGAGGSATVLRGDPGIGKSALLDWTATRADGDGFTVLRAAGHEPETGVAFGALHQVLRPLWANARALPGPQLAALERVLGLREGLPPSGFMVGAAVLALLAEEARRRPVLILVDDLHWVDSSSVAVFVFLHRRITGLRVVMVGASRAEDGAAPGRDEHTVDLGVLSREDARALLRHWHPGLAPSTAQRVMDEAVGNPLALAELPGQLAYGHRRGVVPLPDRLPLGRRLESLFARRLRALPADARRLLLLTALDGIDATGGGALREPGLGRTEQLVERVEASGLARLDATGRLVFRHPLVRSAVIASSEWAERQAAHRTLAARLREDDPRRLTHEALAADGPDERLAARLHRAGERIALRGGDAEAALLLERAAALGPDPGDRARRLTWAAVMSARGGRLAHAASLVEEVRRGPVPEDVAPLFAYAVVYVDQSHHVDFASSIELLPGALAALTAPGAPDSGDLVEQMFFKLLLAVSYTGDARGRRALERYTAHVSPAARLCHRAWADPPRTAHGAQADLRVLTARMTAGREAGNSWLVLWAAAAVDAADADLWRLFGGEHAYATQGSVAKARYHQAFLRGEWEAAEESVAAAERADEAGYHCNALLFRFYYAHFLAGRGDAPALREVRERIGPAAARARMRLVTEHLERLEALVLLANGRHEEAYARLRRLMAPGELPCGLAWFHLPFFDLVDACLGSGRRAEALAHVAAGRAARMDGISAHHAFLLAAATAMTADDGDADTAYAVAYAVRGSCQWVFERARLRLAHGSWLRRRGRGAEASGVLRAACRTFRALGAEPWVARCRSELRAVEAPLGGGSADGGGLTAQELRIARLVATGLTNKEVGAALRLSPRTVGAHLYRIFPKLGISSRAALARALPGG
ncbi:LuxR family transcriptional regulator [Streptomyces sp. NPDC023327]|uniref:ATP-binding protein n=1 Tax=Streptomyces sp. NPDC023327 TaxID=3157088 RepID=UPI0034061BC7